MGCLLPPPAKVLELLTNQELGTSPIALGSLISSMVIPSFGLETEGEDWVNEEIGWLFRAVDNLLTAAQQVETTGSVGTLSTIAVSIPENAEMSVGLGQQSLVD